MSGAWNQVFGFRGIHDSSNVGFMRMVKVVGLQVVLFFPPFHVLVHRAAI
jgi:hypothetical protein